MLAAVDSVADRATAAAAHGLTEFRGECEAHRALAQGNYAAIEGTLAGNLAGKVGQIRAEWTKETEVAIISANSFAAIVESSRVALSAQLPAKFGGIVRSAFSEARKSRLKRFGEGVWGAVSGLVTTVAKFVAAALIIVFAPIAFTVAALMGKAGALVGIVRDAAMAIVGMAQAFADRFRVLFRTWDDWPWYGKVAGLWATTLVAIGDTIGLPSIFEGVTGRELISNRELSYDERGSKTAGGGIAAFGTAVPAKVHADKAARNARAFQVGQEVGELEARAAASQAEAKAAGAADNAAGQGVDDASKVRGPGENPVVMAGDELDLYQYAERIPPVPGMLDVVLHGSLDEFYIVRSGKRVPISHRALAQKIRESGAQFERIRLISCETGAHTKGAAQHLSNQLGVDVYAPTEKIIIKADGSYVIGPKVDVPRGHWQKFSPKKSELRYTPAKEPPSPDLRERLRIRQEQRGAQAADSAGSQQPAAGATPRGGEAKTLGRDRMRELADSFNEQALDELDRADGGSGSLFDEYGPDANLADEPIGRTDGGGRPAPSELPPRHRDLLDAEHQDGVTTRSHADAQQSGIVPDEGAVYTDQHHVFPDEHRKWFEDPKNVKQDPAQPFDVDDYAMDIEHELHGTMHAGRGQWAGEWNARILNALQRERKLLGRPLTVEDMKVVASRELAAMGITETPYRRYTGTKDTAARRESMGKPPKGKR
ncbi:MAG: hypothetical protein F9K40_03950 [Kofleriaceae bacterium]|nr:MAG: hypothetical protein F9K40_03950 [Kofleriaceae bacterium]